MKIGKWTAGVSPACGRDGRGPKVEVNGRH